MNSFRCLDLNRMKNSHAEKCENVESVELNPITANKSKLHKGLSKVMVTILSIVFTRLNLNAIRPTRLELQQLVSCH